MTFFDFQQFNIIDSIKKHIENIKTNILLHNINYPFVEKVNIVLDYFKDNEEQLEIINKKIRQQKDIESFYDTIAELLVIYEHLNENAKFINETKNETPDIKTDKYLIEVKRVRLSDDQIGVLDELTSRKNIIMSSTSKIKDLRNNDEPKALNKKIKEKIDKAIKQIGNKEGVIYIVFSLDLSGHYQDLNSRKKIFKCFCFDYFNSKHIKNIKLFVNDLNDIIRY
ncbi:hypothetical protein EOM09_06625 [bacterium]|nr:hypothetical protein [bacterium]